MDWLLSSLNSEITQPTTLCFCGKGGNGKGGNWGRHLPLCCWREEDSRFPQLCGLALTSRHCATPWAVQLPSLFLWDSGAGSGYREQPQKSLLAALLSSASTRTAHSFPCLKQFHHQHQIFISLSWGETNWPLWRGGRQCLASMWEEAKHKISW